MNIKELIDLESEANKAYEKSHLAMCGLIMFKKNFPGTKEEAFDFIKDFYGLIDDKLDIPFTDVFEVSRHVKDGKLPIEHGSYSGKGQPKQQTGKTIGGAVFND